MGQALQNFTDFMATTGPATLTGPEDVINEAVKQNYFFSRMLKGRGMDEVIQGGDTIQDFIMFDDSSTATNYSPNQAFTPENPQVTSTITRPWRFTVDHMSWTEQEVLLQAGANTTRASRKVAYKRLQAIKERRLWTSIANHIEDSIWKPGHNITGYTGSAQQEDATGVDPISILSLISEDTTNYHPSGWTTIQGIDPANEDRWRNQVVTYDFADPDDSDGDGDGLLEAFDDMLERVQFIPPDFHKEEFEAEGKQNDPRKCIIATSRRGKTLYKQQLRARNDTLVRHQDAEYNDPRFAGYEVVHVANLTTAQQYAGAGSTWIEEQDANVTTTGARYHWLNMNYIKVIFHSEKYFDKTPPKDSVNQPFTKVQYVDCWWNCFCRSRRRQGIVSPGA